jgi:uncharacterized protein
MKTIITAVFLLAITIYPVTAQQIQSGDSQAKITVNGEAIVKVRPDQILITFGIETWDKNIMIAKQENNEIMKKATIVIKESGIDRKNVQTDYLSIEPRYDDNYNKKNFIGYFVRNTFIVTMTDPGKVEELVTKILQSGVNYIHRIDFQTTEFKKYREQARELALNTAKEKAVKMAAVLGQVVRDPIQISEGYSGSGWWYYSSWSGWSPGRYNSMSQNVIQNVSNSPEQTSEIIELGKISVKANVTVVFELKK